MLETLCNMTLAEDGVLVLGVLVGVLVGWMIAAYRHWSADRRFNAVEKIIERKMAKATLGELGDMAEARELKLAGSVRAVLKKIKAELADIDCDPNDNGIGEAIGDLEFDIGRILGERS